MNPALLPILIAGLIGLLVGYLLGQKGAVSLPAPLARMLNSSKVWLGALAALQTYISTSYNIDPKVWVSINAVIGVCIAAIAAEDAAAKRAATRPKARRRFRNGATK